MAYALSGSSRQLIIGPDAATCLMLAASLAPLAAGDPERYLALVPVRTLITGCFYIGAGYARLIAKSFARRNRYDIDADQEFEAFVAGNLASAFAQGFPVTGADSRTAVNAAMPGQTQLVGIVAAVAMLLVLFFLTAPLALVPTTALAAVILVSATDLCDCLGPQKLWAMTRRAAGISIVTTLGVLILGVLQGVVLAIALSLFWMLAMAVRPGDAVLGRSPGLEGFHSKADYPSAETVPGLILYRFNANIVFYNVDYFRERLVRRRRRAGRRRRPAAFPH